MVVTETELGSDEELVALTGAVTVDARTASILLKKIVRNKFE